jgi:hypothetical protein
MKRPKTKPEKKVQYKLNLNESLAAKCDAAKKEAEDTPYSWDATMAEVIEKETASFRQFVAEFKAKSQPESQAESQADSSLNSSLKAARSNGADAERA